MGFKKKGYLLAKRILSENEVDKLIKEINLCFESTLVNSSSNHGYIENCVAENRAFWNLIYHPKILKEIRNILGEEAKFLQHNSIFKNFSAGQWHRDSVDKIYNMKGDWSNSDPYKIVRVALYLQDTTEYKYRLGFIEGSNLKKVSVLERNTIFSKYLQGLEKRIVRLNITDFYFPFLGRCHYPRLKKGDMLIFDPRIYHRATITQYSKHAVIFAFGIENSHFKKHERHYLNKPGYSRLSEDLKIELRKRNLLKVES